MDQVTRYSRFIRAADIGIAASRLADLQEFGDTCPNGSVELLTSEHIPALAARFALNTDPLIRLLVIIVVELSGMGTEFGAALEAI